MNKDGAGSDRFYHPADKWLTSAIGLAFVKLLVVAFMYIDGAVPSDVVRLGLVSFAVLLWLTIMIGHHANWARSAMLLFVVVYIPFGIESTFKFQYLAHRLATLAESVALAGGVFIIFGRHYKEWPSAPSLTKLPSSYQVGDEVKPETVARTEDPVPSDAAYTSPQVATEVKVESDERYRGWKFWQWAIVFWIMIFIFSAEGIKVRYSNDQGFLYGVIALQSAIGSIAVRVVSGAFHTRYSWRIIFRIAAVAALAYLLLSLTLCSHLARHGWG